jgi:GT2 family glycosyltransferase
MESYTISASIVLFKENLSDLHKTIDCFLNIQCSKKLFLVDNTPNRFFEYLFVDEDIEYISIFENIGFGSAHNKIISKIENKSKYHLILNPDVIFDEEVIVKLIKELHEKDNLAMIAPRVLFPNKTHQYSCRRYPSISELLARRFTIIKPIFQKTINKGQYKDKNLNTPFIADYLTGCFHLYKTKYFIKVGGFDERYFMYMEDIDICKKIDAIGKQKLYYPYVEIIHILKQGSAKKTKLFFIHIISAIKYFLKWSF